MLPSLPEHFKPRNLGLIDENDGTANTAGECSPSAGMLRRPLYSALRKSFLPGDSETERPPAESGKVSLEGGVLSVVVEGIECPLGDSAWIVQNWPEHH